MIIPKEQLSDLFRLREFAACGSIAEQVRKAISNYLVAQEKEIGCSPEDLESAILKHEREATEEQHSTDEYPS